MWFKWVQCSLPGLCNKLSISEFSGTAGSFTFKHFVVVIVLFIFCKGACPWPITWDLSCWRRSASCTYTYSTARSSFLGGLCFIFFLQWMLLWKSLPQVWLSPLGGDWLSLPTVPKRSFILISVQLLIRIHINDNIFYQYEWCPLESVPSHVWKIVPYYIWLPFVFYFLWSIRQKSHFSLCFLTLGHVLSVFCHPFLFNSYFF